MKRYIRSAIAPLSEESYEVKRQVIDNSRCLVASLLELLHDSDPVIRNAASLRLDDIARHSNNEADLMRIVDTQDFNLGWEISRNPNASSAVLACLCSTPLCQPDNPDLQGIANGLIPYCIADNPNVSVETLQLLANTYPEDDKNWAQVREKAKAALTDRGIVE